MSPAGVLVAYASQSGYTAGIAEVIASEIRRTGLPVDCRPASEVDDLTAYTAVVLGSGVFLSRRASDGGGFLPRHAAALRTRRVWLFTAGPIGRARTHDGGVAGDGAVVDVARRIGASGAATFGALDLSTEPDALERIQPVDLARVRGWARSIADELAGSGSRATGHERVAAAM